MNEHVHSGQHSRTSAVIHLALLIGMTATVVTLLLALLFGGLLHAAHG